jgi:hypothetical protein
VETAAELRALAVGYAGAVDDRDGPALGRLFADDATLVVRDRPTGADATPLVGDRIAGIAASIARYPATLHLLGQSSYDVDGDRATGVVYCEAHHHLGELGAAATDRVMYIRYLDEYRRDDSRDEGDRWRIATRVVEVQWTNDVPVQPRGAGPAAGAST